MTEYNNKFIPKAPNTYEVKYVDLKEPSFLSRAASKAASYLGMKTVENCSYSGCSHSTDFDLDISIEGCKWWARNPNYGTSLPGYWKPSPTTSYYSRENLWLNHIGHAYDADSLIGQNNLYTVGTLGQYAAEDYEFCVGTQNFIRECVKIHKQGYPINESKTLPSETTRATKWTIKVGVALGSAVIPGATPLALATAGGLTWAGGEAVKSLCDSDKAKHAWGIVSDAGFDTVRGAAISQNVENAGRLVGIGATGNSLVGNMAGKFAGNVEGAIGGVNLGWEFCCHASHLAKGESYDSSCPICNSQR